MCGSVLKSAAAKSSPSSSVSLVILGMRASGTSAILMVVASEMTSKANHFLPILKVKRVILDWLLLDWMFRHNFLSRLNHDFALF